MARSCRLLHASSIRAAALTRPLDRGFVGAVLVRRHARVSRRELVTSAWAASDDASALGVRLVALWHRRREAVEHHASSWPAEELRSRHGDFGVLDVRIVEKHDLEATDTDVVVDHGSVAQLMTGIGGTPPCGGIGGMPPGIGGGGIGPPGIGIGAPGIGAVAGIG